MKHHGKPNGRQRYRCHACHKTFMCTCMFRSNPITDSAINRSPVSV
ncbi:IS1/IS1595 family N-terminal zinc-binding domain-containing protein [Shewanella glacialipiscicola]